MAEEQGVARCGWAWTGKFADFDNSGDLDLFVINGKARGSRVRTADDAVRSFAFVRNTITATPPPLREQMSLVPDFSKYYLSAFERSCLFWQKDGHFYDVAPEAGILDLEEGQSAALVDFEKFAGSAQIYADKCVRTKGLASFRFLVRDAATMPEQKSAALPPSAIGLYWKDEAMRKLDAGPQFVEIVGRVRLCETRNRLQQAAGTSSATTPCRSARIAIFVSQSLIFPTAMD